MMKSFNKRGVTMMEVMVCLLIIVILLSLIMPVFQRAKKSAKSAVCVSNMHQIYLALKLYESDFDEYPPNSAVWPGFKSYYPVLLRCPEGKDIPEFHYTLMASISGSENIPAEGGRTVGQLFAECKLAREGDMPLVLDQHHAKLQLNRQNLDFIFVARENGAINRVSLSQAYTKPKPCLSPPLALELNY